MGKHDPVLLNLLNERGPRRVKRALRRTIASGAAAAGASTDAYFHVLADAVAERSQPTDPPTMSLPGLIDVIVEHHGSALAAASATIRAVAREEPGLEAGQIEAFAAWFLLYSSIATFLATQRFTHLMGKEPVGVSKQVAISMAAPAADLLWTFLAGAVDVSRDELVLMSPMVIRERRWTGRPPSTWAN